MSSPKEARWALGVLLAVNLLNYLDRQVLYALLPLIKADLGATDAQLGVLASAFMLVYMLAAPPVGYLADRTSRKAWIASGLAIWSGATVLSGLAGSFRTLFLSRAAVGIGESCYGSISPSFVAEHYPPEKRAGALALFSMAIPVGSALGYILGGAIGFHWGWRRAFFLAGLPGFFLTWFVLRLRDPRREGGAGREAPPLLAEYLQLGRNRSYLVATLAMAAMTFGLGAFAVWMPSFFNRAWGYDVAQAGTLFGGVTVLAGLAGSLAGGWLAERALRLTPNANLLVSGVGLLLALPFGAATLLAGSRSSAALCLFLAEFCAFLNMGPLNAQIVAVTSPRMRSMAFAANILVIHALGDAASPTLVGWLSDVSGLATALLAATSSLGVAGLLCLWGIRFAQEDVRLVGEAAGA